MIIRGLFPQLGSGKLFVVAAYTLKFSLPLPHSRTIPRAWTSQVHARPLVTQILSLSVHKVLEIVRPCPPFRDSVNVIRENELHASRRFSPCASRCIEASVAGWLVCGKPYVVSSVVSGTSRNTIDDNTHKETHKCGQNCTQN